jgi:hypothetical protein
MLCVSEMLTHRSPAQEAPDVYEHIKDDDRSMLGVLLEWGDGLNLINSG